MSIVTTERRRTPLVQEFQKIFKEHAQLVYRTAYGVTGSHEDAEDILQTLFLRLLRRSSPELQRNPQGYLYRAAVNLSVDVIRSRRRQIPFVDADGLEVEAPADELKNEELHRQLYEAIAELKPRSAETVILRYVHDKSDAEIAKMLGVSRGTVALRLFRSRARLKRLLRAKMGETR